MLHLKHKYIVYKFNKIDNNQKYTLQNSARLLGYVIVTEHGCTS